MNEDAQTRRKWSGQHIQSLMGWLFARHFKAAAPALPPTNPREESQDPSFDGGGSPNMELGYRACWYEASDAPVHRQRVLNWFAAQRREHGSGEPSPASHIQLWLAFVMAILATAIRRGDAVVKAEAIFWLAAEYTLCTVGVTEDPDADAKKRLPVCIWLPGARGVKGDGTIIARHHSRDKWFSAIQTGKAPWKENQTDLAAHLAKRLPQDIRAAIRMAPEDMPPMRGRFVGRRLGEGLDAEFFAYYTELPKAPGEQHAPQGRVLSVGRDANGLWASREIEWSRIDLRADFVLEVEAPSSLEKS